MNIQKMMQQAKDMQDKMQSMQADLEHIEVEGVSGGGLVKVVMSAKGDVKSINLDESILVPSEKEVIEDLVKAALNDANTKKDQKTADETKRIMGDMGLPADMKLPF